MVTLKSKIFEDRYVIIPIIGKTYFDENGCVEVENDKVDQLMAYSEELKLSIADSSGVVINDTSDIVSEVVEPPVVEVAEEDEIKKITDLLNSKTVVELKALVKKYPTKETKLLKKKSSYVDYLVSKL